jgi:hypothetical protein
MLLRSSVDIAICAVVLHLAPGDLLSPPEPLRRPAMRTSFRPLRQTVDRRAGSERIGGVWPLIAFYSAFALIAAIAFGTTSVHPF